MSSPRLIGIEEACQRLDMTEAELMEVVASRRLPDVIIYRQPRRPEIRYFDRPQFERALARIVKARAYLSIRVRTHKLKTVENRQSGPWFKPQQVAAVSP
ncbi:hypothetical protein [Yoonia sp.]|uniref:hypothetical protein n=1 Tax=Yoonia sp. TaxID=2212373 RepID=UPI00358F651C